MKRLTLAALFLTLSTGVLAHQHEDKEVTIEIDRDALVKVVHDGKVTEVRLSNDTLNNDQALQQALAQLDDKTRQMVLELMQSKTKMVAGESDEIPDMMGIDVEADLRNEGSVRVWNTDEGKQIFVLQSGDEHAHQTEMVKKVVINTDTQSVTSADAPEKMIIIEKNEYRTSNLAASNGYVQIIVDMIEKTELSAEEKLLIIQAVSKK